MMLLLYILIWIKYYVKHVAIKDYHLNLKIMENNIKHVIIVDQNLKHLNIKLNN